MPRPPRADRRPEIWLHDTRAQEQAVRGVMLGQYGALVYRRGADIPRSVAVSDELEDRVAYLQSRGIRIDRAVLHYMVLHCDLCKYAPVLDEHKQQVLLGDKIRIRLHTIGCRVTLTQAQIAHGCGCSRDHVIEQIKIMKSWYFIVNSGKGWYEFAALLCWRGSKAIQLAYIAQQRVNDGIEIVGQVREVTDAEMYADEHSPRGRGKYGEHDGN